MSNKRKQKQNKLYAKMFGLLLGLCLVAGISMGSVSAENADDRKLKNGSFESGQDAESWSTFYNTQLQDAIPSWNTTASDKKIELFKKNDGRYITGVELVPTDGDVAAELNANEESTLYQNVKTTPSSIYEWGLDHGARNGTDTMALVIGPKQAVNPSKPSTAGRDQLMQMIDWLIVQGKTSVKETAGMWEKDIVVYSKKFAANGTFQDNTDNNAFSLTPSSIYTEEWHIWIMADSKSTSGTNAWGKYGSNADSSSGTGVALNKDYLYTVPSGQTETLFGFVSVGFVNPATDASKAKTYGNFLDNINFKIFHPLSGSSTLHGSGVVSDSAGATSGEAAISSGYEVKVDNKLITYAVDGEPLKVQAIVRKNDADAGCEFVGLYYTTQDASGNLVTKFLQKAGNEIEYSEGLSTEDKKDKWIKSINNGDIIYTYYLDDITTATDLHFVFIKSPTVTYDPNGGKDYTVERTYNTDEAANVYSYKPFVEGEYYTFISPYVSHAAEGQNEGWKFMGWLLTGDTVDPASIPEETNLVNAGELGKLMLPAEHTIACDYAGASSKKEQYFKIYNGNIALTENTNHANYTKWETSDTVDIAYANVHKGLTMVAQWRWRQAFLPQLKSSGGYVNSDVGGTVKVTSVAATDPNYNAAYKENGGISYHAETDEMVTVEATAKQGFEFEGWYDASGNLLSTKAKYSFTETKENVGTYYARFSGSVTQTYIRQVKNGDVWVATEDDDIATLDRYSYSDTVGKQISSTATVVNAGYEFVGWYDADGNAVASEQLLNGGKTLSYTTTGNATYYARFQKLASANMTQKFIRQLRVGGVWTDIAGEADHDAGTLDCYSHSGAKGAAVSSTATVKTGYKFEGWYDAAGNPVATGMLSPDKTTISYTTTGDATYYARFSKIVTQTFIRQVKSGDTWVDANDSIGTLTSYTHKDGEGATASSTAEAKEGYKFVGWYDGAETKVEEGDTLSYTTSGNTTYYARFEKKVTQTFIRQVKNGTGWDTTTENSVGTLTLYTHTDVAGKTVTSEATAGEGYEFVGWYDGAETKVAEGDTLSYTTSVDATYYARFQREGTAQTVTQEFIRQVKDGESWIDTAEDSIGILNPYSHLGAVGETASSTATAGEGYEFVGWYDGAGIKVAEGNTLSYTTSGNATYYARFQREVTAQTVTQTYIRQVKDGSIWENTTDDTIAILDCYTHTNVVGATARSTATAKEGYEFVGWYDVSGNPVAGNMISSNGTTLNYITTGNAIYYARFQREETAETVTQTYIRQIKAGDTWKDTTDDSIATLDCYTHTDVVGAIASSTATAGKGYKFVGWYDAEGKKVAEDMLNNNGKTLSYTTIGDASYYARFNKSSSSEDENQTDSDQGKDEETKKNKPETGDECNPALWTVLLLIAIAALAELNAKRKNYK